MNKQKTPAIMTVLPALGPAAVLFSFAFLLAAEAIAAGGGFAVEKVFSYPAQLSSNRILSVSASDEYAAAATPKGIDVYVKSDNRWHSVNFPGENIRQVKVDKVDVLCLSEHTLFKYNPATKRKTTIFSDKNAVFNSFTLNRGVIFIASSVGIYKLNSAKKDKQHYGIENGLSTGEILDVAAKGDFVFAAPAGAGISRYIPKSDYFANYFPDDDMFSNTRIKFSGISLWCGTNGRGLREFNLGSEKWTVYSMKDGLADDFVQALETDGSKLWVGTFDGLSVFDMEKPAFTSYGVKDGLPESSITSLCIDGNHIWIGTDNGLVLANKYTPQVIIEPDMSFITEENLKDRINFEINIKDSSAISGINAYWSLGAFYNIWSDRNIRASQPDKKSRSEAVWIVKNLASYNDAYFVKVSALNALGFQNHDIVMIKFDAVNPIVKVDPVIGAPEAGPYKITGTYNKIDIMQITVNPGGIKAVLDNAAYSYSAVVNLQQGINIVEVTVEDQLGRKAVELVEIYSELKEEPLIAKRDQSGIIPAQDAEEYLISEETAKKITPKKVFLSEMVLFYPGSVRIRESSYKFMENLAFILKKNDSLKITVEGYAYAEDLQGSPFRNNKELSLARALVVGEYLVNTAGIPKKRLKMAGLSSNKVLVTPKSESDKNINRRVEIHLYSE